MDSKRGDGDSGIPFRDVVCVGHGGRVMYRGTERE